MLFRSGDVGRRDLRVHAAFLARRAADNPPERLDREVRGRRAFERVRGHRPHDGTLVAQLVGRDHDYVIIRLNSGEQRLVHGRCTGTIGAVSNPDHMNISIGKAGRNRWLGRKPHNRGVSMNPVDHPHGGGEGRTSGGRHPVTPWGKPTKGKKTRSNKSTNRFILISRHKRKK